MSKAITVQRLDVTGSSAVAEDIAIPEHWGAGETRSFIDSLLVPGTAIPDVCRGLLIVVENLAMRSLAE